MSEATLIRLVILALGLLWLGYIWWSWNRRQAQAEPNRGPLRRPEKAAGRTEPVMHNDERPGADMLGGADQDMRAELERLSREIAGRMVVPVDRADGHLHDLDSLRSTESETLDDEPMREAASADRHPREAVGQRPAGGFDRIITLHVVAREGETIAGPELVVAAERSGLSFGDMDVFHRMVDGYAERGPIFSVVNMLRPGSFDMTRVQDLRTPGVTFFMTLPGPLRAIDAWDTMLPAAQRFADLLDAQVLDEQRNALARQTIQVVREEMRAWDRDRERQTIRRTW
jgi:cell division protein ZipA